MRDFEFRRRGGAFEMEVSGGMVEIAEAVGTVIGSIHSSFLRKDPGEADCFRYLIEEMVKHPDTPLWNGNAIAGGATILVVRSKK